MRARRLAGIVGLTLAGLVAALALLGGGLVALLHTRAGSDFVLARALPAVDAAIAGQLAVDRLTASFRRIVLTGIVLRDPEGRVVATVDRIEVGFSPLPLVRARVLVRRVEVSRPRLFLVQDARGLNLARALAPRAPARAEQEAGPAVTVVVERLALAGGEVELVGLLPERLVLRELAARGAGRYQPGQGGPALAAELTLDGRQITPFAAPLALSFSGQWRDGAGAGELALSLGSSRLAFAVRAPDPARQEVTLQALRVTPALLTLVAPSPPLVAPIAGHGTIVRRGGEVELDLGFEVAGGRMTFSGRLDSERRYSPGFVLRGQGLDLGGFVRGAPRSNLAFSLAGRGGGRSLEGLTGELSLAAPEGSIGGRPIGPIEAAITARAGSVELRRFSAALPGATITARGRGSRRGVELSATLRAARLSETVRSLLPDRAPPLAGTGELAATLSGAWAAPALRARGRFADLALGPHRARSLALRARVPNLRRPWRASAQLEAGAATVAARRLGRLGVSLSTGPGRTFNARVSLARPQPLTLAARGTWSEDGTALALERLALSYPGAAWHLVVPAQLRFGDVVVVDRLRLAAADQRLAIDLSFADDQLDAHAALDRVALARLPAIARPPGLALGGRIDARVAARGPPDDLTVDVRAALANGRVGQVRDLALSLAARWAGQRLAGRLDAGTPAGQVRARFDLPAAYPPPPRAPVDLALEAAELELATLAALVGRAEAGIAGRARVSARLAGTAAAPALDARATLRDLGRRGRAIGGAELTVAAAPGQPLTASLALEALGQPARADLVIPSGLGRLLAHRPRGDDLLALPFTARAHADIPLAFVARLAGRAERGVGGRASLSLTVAGPARAATGSLDLRLVGAHAPGLPPTDAHLALAAGEGAAGVTGALAITRGARTLAHARASLGLPTARFADPVALARAPLALEAVLGPVRLQRLVAPADGDRKPPRVLSGRLAGHLELSGSLGAPRLRGEADLRDATLEGAALGHASLRLAYDDGGARLELRLDGSDGGYVRLRGRAELDLGYPYPAGGLPLARMPVHAELEAHRYDLAPLSCLSDLVRVVEGRLLARATLTGPLARPALRGRLEWRDGRLLVAGAGDYRAIHLLAHGDEQRFVLDELRAESGGGRARVTATAARATEGLRLTAAADLRRFPIHAGGQRVASVSLAPRLEGRISTTQADLRARIDEAHVTLAAGQRRDLQSLQRPHDVVLFAGDEPLNRTQARKHQALVDARRALGSDRQTAPPDAAPAPDRGPPLVRLALDAPRNLWISSSDVNLELGLGPDFVVLARPEPSVFGTVFVRRGQVELIGRRFRIEPDSMIRFNGPPETPALQIEAVHQPRHADMTVVVSVTGAPEDLALTVRSPEHPEYAQTDLLNVVVTGRPPDEGADAAATPSARAASLLGGLLADRLQRTLMRRLPIDVLEIDPGDELEGTRLEAGTYLGDDLYVGYVGRIGGEDPFQRENQNEVQLEYRLSRRWSFEAVYGDARRGSADLVWTRRY